MTEPKDTKRHYTRPEHGYRFERLQRDDPGELIRLATSGGHATIAKYGRDAHLSIARAAKARISAARRTAEAFRIAEEHKDCLAREAWTATEVLVHDWRCCPRKAPTETVRRDAKAGGAR